MSETIRVRDHSRPCQHGLLWPHWERVSEAKWWQEPECPGGKEMLLRRVGDGLWREGDADEAHESEGG